MNRPTCVLGCLVALSTVVCSASFAQRGAVEEPEGPYRKLAPGVLKSVSPQRHLEECFSRHDIVELLAIDGSFDWAKNEVFRREVWTLELKFKPMRMIWVDVPQPEGFMDRRLIWYMVYSVTNQQVKQMAIDLQAPEGAPQFGWICPVRAADGTYGLESKNKPIRFVPRFFLEAPEFGKVYPDRVIPVAVGIPGAPGPICTREDPKRRFYTTVEMAGKVLNPGETLWGVVTWEGIDPRIDRFSVYIQGLTNAYRWRDEKGRYKRGDAIGTGRRLSRKTLKLNFWRPGDQYYEDEREIRYGIPGEVDYEWVYR